jgi:hypothetical protein
MRLTQSRPQSRQPQTLTDLLSEVLSVRCISRETQRVLMDALLNNKDELTYQEQEQVSRIFDGLNRRAIRVID